MSTKRQRQTYEAPDPQSNFTAYRSQPPLSTPLYNPSSPPLSPSTTPTPNKQARLLPSATTDANGNSTYRPVICTLPPTCNPPHNRPTELPNSKELEIHYGKYHAHVCQVERCGRIFPDERFLELHLIECHDPMTAVKKERGEKIFACFLPSCGRFFSVPKTRRLHLIEAHNYPKEYFFAVTNKGVGGLLKKWGEGASLLRGEWKARDRQDAEDEDIDGDIDTDTSVDSAAQEGSTKQEGRHIGQERLSFKKEFEEGKDSGGRNVKQDTVDNLTSSLDSLSLVPTKIRFGRGGKNGRLVRQQGMERPDTPSSTVGVTEENQRESDVASHQANGRNMGRGRGRGQGQGRQSHARDLSSGNDSIASAGDQQVFPSSASSSSLTPINAEVRSAPKQAEPEEQGPVSINIDAALDAMKAEEPWKHGDGIDVPGRSIRKDNMNDQDRGGFRSRGRGGARGRGRGRGFMRG